MDIESLRERALGAVAAATDLAALDDQRVTYLGKKGEVTQQLKQLGDMEPEQRKIAGQQINALKKDVIAAIEVRKEALQQAAIAQQVASESVDVTLPGRGRAAGA